MAFNPAQPPAGILDPQQPWWPAKNISERLWLQFKAKLTGNKMPGGGQYSSFVRITEADADRIVENIKKYGRYPQVNQGGKDGGYSNLQTYQEWLVEEFLEKPFQENIDNKINDAQVERRLEEIKENRAKEKVKSKKMDSIVDPWQEATIPPKIDEKEEQQEEKEVVKQVDKLIKDVEESTEDDKKDQQQTQEKNPALEKALESIQSTLSTHSSTLSQINGENSNSIQTIEILKNLFSTQTEILKSQEEINETRENESRLESGTDLSSVSDSTSTIGENFAEGEILKVDGDMLTVKTLDGAFTEGQRISTGKKGGGFLSMLQDIAGKFFSRGKGGGAKSPTKLSSGGIMRSPTPLNKGAFIPPGIYDSPTRGNLLPGQAVIPLNRNIGKGLDPSKQVIKKSQPLADTLQAPVKLTGAALLKEVGLVIATLGPLGGFLSPFVRANIGPLGKIFGLGVSTVQSLLGISTSSTQEKNNNIKIFSEVWNKVMDKFGISLGKDDKKKDKAKSKGRTPAPDLTDVEATDYPASNDAAFKKIYDIAVKVGDPIPELTAAQAMFESGWLKSPKARLDNNPFGQTGSGTAGKVWSNGRWWARYKTLEDAVKSRIERWSKSTPQGGSGYNSKAGAPIPGLMSILEHYAPSKENDHTSYIKGVSRILKSYGFKLNEKNDKKTLSAESGISSSQGNPLTAFTLTGPNSGYRVPGIGEMHGKEAVIEYERGFTILPIENNKFSMTNDPLNTILRWKELLGSRSLDNPSGIRRFADGGKVTLYSGHADMTANSPGGKGTNGGPSGNAPMMPQARGYFTNEAYLNDKIAKMAASKSGGHAVYRAPIKTKNGSDPDSNWTRAKKDVQRGDYPVEIHHDAENGKPGVITTSKSVATGNPAFNSITNAFGYYRNGDEGFVTRGGMILEMDALKKSIRQNPSSWISSASTKLANAIKRNGATSAEPRAGDSNDSIQDGEQSAEEQAPVDPFEAMEKAIKDMSVNIALLKGVESGQIKDVESFKQMRESLYTATDQPVSTPSPQLSPAVGAQNPNVQIVNKDGKKIIMTGSGNNRTPVGILEDNVCRAFG